MNDLEEFLQRVGNFAYRTTSRTLFSLGGRGYYENPTSDLLSFFMNPTEEHGLGSAFLGAFFECLPIELCTGNLPMDRVEISREESTANQKRIDLVLRGMGWMMLIENKIHHWQANPFSDYEEHFTRMNGGRLPMFVILSPDGKSGREGWMGVSYGAFCESLLRTLSPLKDRIHGSKWLVFANELIVHLQNELYQLPMKKEAIELLEDHWDQVQRLQKLVEDYRAFLHRELRRLLDENLDDPLARTKEDKWAIRCFGSAWGQGNIAWWYQADPSGMGIRLSVYIPSPDERQIAIGQEKFESHSMVRVPEGAWLGWQGRQSFETRESAMEEFVRLVRVMREIYQPSETLPIVSYEANQTT